MIIHKCVEGWLRVLKPLILSDCFQFIYAWRRSPDWVCCTLRFVAFYRSDAGVWIIFCIILKNFWWNDSFLKVSIWHRKIFNLMDFKIFVCFLNKSSLQLRFLVLSRPIFSEYYPVICACFWCWTLWTLWTSYFIWWR